METVKRALKTVPIKPKQFKHSNELGFRFKTAVNRWPNPYPILSKVHRTVRQNHKPASNSVDNNNPSNLCMNQDEYDRMSERVNRLGKEFVKLFKQSTLFCDLVYIPGWDFHLHLVRLFFLDIGPNLTQLTMQLQHNDLFSDLTMLDLQRKAQKCKSDENQSKSWSELDEGQFMIGSNEDIASLQAVLLTTDSQFKQFKSLFTKLIQENKVLIKNVPINREILESTPNVYK